LFSQAWDYSGLCCGKGRAITLDKRRWSMNKRGQSTLEYAIILAVIITAIVFIGRGIFRNALQNALTSASNRIANEATNLE
jgi:Flp pilus assembly pilin Flp